MKQSINSLLQPSVRQQFYQGRTFEEPLCNRLFNLHSSQGRQELRFIYFFFLSILTCGITVVTGWYFIEAEIEQRESVRVILLFSCSLGFVVFSSVGSGLLSVYTDDVDLNRDILLDSEVKVEFEKRVYFMLNILVLGGYVAVLVLAYNVVLEGLTVFLSIGCFILWQYSFGRLFLELNVLRGRNSAGKGYILTAGVLTFFSLLGTALSLVDLS
jgi:hypothetical protein